MPDNLETLLQVYLDYFKGREDYIACQGETYYYPINQELSESLIIQHLKNLMTYGIYVLNSQSKCNFVCIDIDIPKDEIKDEHIQDLDKKFQFLKERLFKITETLYNELNIDKKQILFEDTGGRGYHIWIFFEEQIEGTEALRLNNILKHFIDFDFEFFPKQPDLNPKRRFGNLIKLPLGKHQKYKNKSRFFHLKDNNLFIINSLRENFNHLKHIEKVPHRIIEQIIEKFNHIPIKDSPFIYDKETEVHFNRTMYEAKFGYLLEKCSALNSLIIKANSHKQLNRKELFHLANTYLSIENGNDYIKDLLKRFFGDNYSEEITSRELQRLLQLYPASCKKLIDDNICTGFCCPEIERRTLDHLLTNPNPLSFWLTTRKDIDTRSENEIYDSLTNYHSIINTYNKLKRYHKYEDVGFFDEFDYEEYEKDIDINSRYLSIILKEQRDFPLIGYQKYLVPKKLDDNDGLKYRQMVYSNIHDQVMIQSIFGTLSYKLENDFLDCSYGYRVDISSDKDIFKSWKKYYPKFRNCLLGALRKKEVKYYICCDIEKFYDNIRHDILIEQLRKYVDSPYLLNLAKEIIKIYDYSEAEKGKGLPQGPAYARVLANLYLNDFDKGVFSYCYDYYRYVDDFFIFFNTKEDAERGLQKIIASLNLLGLNLSSDEEKKPIILESSDEEIIISKLKSLQYGIFEEFKFIPHVSHEKVKDFYEAIHQHNVTIQTKKELLDINKIVPSLLYIHSHQFNDIKDFRLKVIAIINYLIENKFFYPKRLKIVYLRLIPILKELEMSLQIFYTKLDYSHKIHFLLNLYILFKKEEKYRNDLVDIIRIGLKDSNSFVLGFSIKIYFLIIESSKEEILSAQFLTPILGNDSHFLKLKLLSSINYFDQSNEIREILRDNINANNIYLEKRYLLNSSKVSVLRL